MTNVEISIPRAYAFLFKPKRYKGLWGGRGSAKSHSVARALLVIGMQRPVRVVCAREIQKSIKDSVHKLLADLIREMKLEGTFYDVLETEIRGRNGTEFIFRGLRHNTRDLKSLEGADICWIEEAESVSDNSYEILIPTIRKNGSEIWATWNLKNFSDPTHKRFVTDADDDTISRKVSWRDNPFFPDVLRDEMEKLKRKDYEAYLHVWEGEPDTRRSGAVYAKQLALAGAEHRIGPVPYDESSEVFTAHDLGWGDSYSIWWLQWVGRELRWLECYENSNEPLLHYAQVIKSKPYNYMKNGHFLPHDAAQGNIRGGSVTEQFKTMGIGNQVLPREQDVLPGIELLRQTIGFSAFDKTKCSEGLRALENYGYEWDEDRGMFKSSPKHDWSSHYADAARYGAIAAAKLKGKSPVVKQTDTEYDFVGGYYEAQGWMG